MKKIGEYTFNTSGSLVPSKLGMPKKTWDSHPDLNRIVKENDLANYIFVISNPDEDKEDNKDVILLVRESFLALFASIDDIGLWGKGFHPRWGYSELTYEFYPLRKEGRYACIWSKPDHNRDKVAIPLGWKASIPPPLDEDESIKELIKEALETLSYAEELKKTTHFKVASYS